MLTEQQQQVLNALDEAAVIACAQELVRIPSVNGDEAAAAEYVAERARAAGLQVDVTLVDVGRPNVFAVWRGAAEPEHIALLFHGHTDTIPPLGHPEPFSGALRDGELWGRGTVDQKGGLAAALVALEALAHSGVSLRQSVALAAVIDEESEHRGSIALVDAGLQSDTAIVTEPSGLDVMVGCKGTAPLRFVVHGRTSHSATPWEGDNAITKAAHLIEALEHIPPRVAELPGLPRIQGSLNVGLVEGGTAYNNVPDRCALWCDYRMIPGQTQTAVLAEMKALLDEMTAADANFRVELTVDRPDWHWDRIRQRGLNPACIPPDHPLVATVAIAHQLVFGEQPRVSFSHGYLDMDFLINDLGIPTVCYGPGALALAHRDDERVRVCQLLSAARVYVLTALALAE